MYYTDWKAEESTQNECVRECVYVFYIEQLPEWINEWINEWMQDYLAHNGTAIDKSLFAELRSNSVKTRERKKTPALIHCCQRAEYKTKQQQKIEQENNRQQQQQTTKHTKWSDLN